MRCTRRRAVSLLLAGTTSFQVLGSRGAFAAGHAELDRDVTATLKKLYAGDPRAKEFSKTAKGILVFPRITKGGFMVGGATGDGALRQKGKTTGYYNSSAASFGFLAGVTWFGYALFFMTDESLKYLDKTDGWEVGVGPSIVVMDKGAATKKSTTTAHDIYAFIFDQKGLFAGGGIEGSKITKLKS
jgi:lipid-binding SYLF domain-containing protein